MGYALLLSFALGLGILLLLMGLYEFRTVVTDARLSLVRQPRSTLNEMQRQLMQAGFSSPDAPQRLTQAKLLLPFVLAFAAFLAMQLPLFAGLNPLLRMLMIFIAAMLGYLLPVMYVDRRRAAYRQRIARGLPDALDLMLICIEAGQSVDMAVRRTALELQSVHPDLADGLRIVTEELAAGVERHTAFSQLAEDTGNEDLRALASVIAQSVNMGTPIAHTFRIFAADLRDKRIRKVEEKVNMLPTKMTLGTMMFTVPPLLILLLAPAVYRLMNAF